VDRSAGTTLRLRVEAATPEARERAVAEAWEAGALGAEERDDGLDVYAQEDAAPAVRAALEAAGLACASAEPVEARDWTTAWQAGLTRVEISPRLAVRPSFVPAGGRPGQAELVIEPGQAFGTGGHATTRLALELLDEEAAAGLQGARVLDAGCGTGVLALAALALGAGRALAFDVDPLATEATRQHAAANGLAGCVAVWTGSLEALRPDVRFDLVLANMIRSELLPLLPALARATAARGALVLSGLLEEEEEATAQALAREGFAVEARREVDDPAGDRWLALRARRPAGGEAGP
jgi:ribosomal protein L11 methyltransferase